MINNYDCISVLQSAGAAGLASGTTAAISGVSATMGGAACSNLGHFGHQPTKWKMKKKNVVKNLGKSTTLKNLTSNYWIVYYYYIFHKLNEETLFMP